MTYSKQPILHIPLVTQTQRLTKAIPFRQETRTLIEGVTTQLIADVFNDASLTGRFKTLLGMEDNWDGKGAKRLTPDSLLNFALLLTVVKPGPKVSKEWKSFFHSTDGFLEFVFYEDDVEHNLTFHDDGVVYHNSGQDEEEERHWSLKAIAQALVDTTLFEYNSWEQYRLLTTNDLVFCVDEAQWHQFRLSGYDQDDPLIIPILDIVNQYPGWVTRWSCQGHPDLDDKEGYLCLIVRSDYEKEAITVLNGLLDYVFNQVVNSRTSRLICPVSVERRYVATITPNGVATAPNYIFRFPTDDEDSRTHILTHIETFLKNNLPGVNNDGTP